MSTEGGRSKPTLAKRTLFSSSLLQDFQQYEKFLKPETSLYWFILIRVLEDVVRNLAVFR